MTSNTTQESMAFRYIAGILSNRGVGQQWWLDPLKLGDARARAMVSELKGMDRADVQITPELVVDRFLRNPAISSSMTFDQVFTWVNKAFTSQIPKTEVYDLHDAITRDWVFKSTHSALSKLLPRLDSEEAITDVQAKIRELKASLPGMGVSLKKQFREAEEEARCGASAVIPFGIPIMDKHLGGISRSEVTIIAGRPGHGKTSFAVQLGINWLDQVVPDEGRKLKVMIVSKEMKTFRLLHKVIANRCDELTSSGLHRGTLTDTQRETLTKEVERLTAEYDGRLVIYDDVYDTRSIENAVAKHRPDVLIDDFIQLTACDDSNIRLEILRIMKTYKSIAKEYNCAVVTLSQLNRSIETREDPVPRLSDLAESGSIEQLAADVLFVYYPHKVDHDQPPDRVQLIASKTRYGTTGRFTLAFDGQHMRYRQMPIAVGAA